VGLERGPLRIVELRSYLKEKLATTVWKNKTTDVGNCCANHATPLSAKVGTNFVDTRRSLGQYSSLAQQEYVCIFLSLRKSSLIVLIKCVILFKLHVLSCFSFCLYVCVCPVLSFTLAYFVIDIRLLTYLVSKLINNSSESLLRYIIFLFHVTGYSVHESILLCLITS
jgi:hypothetical protein